MNCEHVSKVLDAYLDRELDDATNRQLDGHLAGCPACGARLVERRALGHSLRTLPRWQLPADRRAALVCSIDAAEGAPGTAAAPAPSAAGETEGAPEPVVLTGRSPPRWRWPAIALCSSVIAFAAGLQVGSPVPSDDAREVFIARHVASLRLGEAKVQVASSDRHTVKPWFAGRIDFAPPVRDLQTGGFTLLGARLDHVSDQPTAAIVYRIREHDINLFVRRSSMPGTEPVVASALRGFSIVTWAEGGLSFVAVSDVDAQDLQRFAQRIRSPVL